MSRTVENRVVLLTGASSGIGLCSAALFASRGWRVGLVSRNADALAAACALIEQRAPGASVAWAAADVTDSAALTAAALAIADRLGPIDVWVNAAGNGVYGRFADVSEAEFRRVTDVTYLGTVNGTRVALSQMAARGTGTIVNVCSAVVFHGVPLMTSYSGAKAAVRAFGQSMQIELQLARSRIRIGTLFPPAINTPFFDHAVSHMGFPARPVPPVYRTEIAARGVYLCATGRGGETVLTGVVLLYSWISRLSPSLAGHLVSMSDFASELPRDHCAGIQPSPARQTSLFGSASSGASMHGPFRRHERRWSSQLGLAAAWRRLFRRDGSAARSLPARAPATVDQAPAGSARPRPAASDSVR